MNIALKSESRYFFGDTWEAPGVGKEVLNLCLLWLLSALELKELCRVTGLIWSNCCSKKKSEKRSHERVWEALVKKIDLFMIHSSIQLSTVLNNNLNTDSEAYVHWSVPTLMRFREDKITQSKTIFREKPGTFSRLSTRELFSPKLTSWNFT